MGGNGSPPALPGDPAAAQRVLAREADRADLARLLHDEAAQTLANLALHLQIAERALQVDVERGRAELTGSIKALGETIARLRLQVFELRPVILEDVGVAATVRRYAAQLPDRSVEVVDELGTRLPAHSELGLYRVVQTVLKHVASASRVELRRGSLVISPVGGVLPPEVRVLLEDWAAALGGQLAFENERLELSFPR